MTSKEAREIVQHATEFVLARPVSRAELLLMLENQSVFMELLLDAIKNRGWSIHRDDRWCELTADGVTVEGGCVFECLDKIRELSAHSTIPSE